MLARKRELLIAPRDTQQGTEMGMAAPGPGTPLELGFRGTSQLLLKKGSGAMRAILEAESGSSVWMGRGKAGGPGPETGQSSGRGHGRSDLDTEGGQGTREGKMTWWAQGPRCGGEETNGSTGVTGVVWKGAPFWRGTAPRRFEASGQGYGGTSVPVVSSFRNS